MSRNASGTYSLPAGNPVITGTTISSTWANSTLSDIATEMTDSLSRSGKGGMLAAFSITDGTQAAPGLSFASELSTGLFRAAAGDVKLSVLNTEVARFADRIAFKSKLAAADSGVDFLFNTTNSRTAGAIFKIQDNGTDYFSMDANGAIFLGGNPAYITASSPNTSLNLRGNRNFDDAGSDVIVDNQATRTAGNLLAVYNNAALRVLFKFDGVLEFHNTCDIKAKASNSALSIFGNKSAGDTGVDVSVDSQVTRTAGNLFRVANNGSERLAVTFNGDAYLNGGAGTLFGTTVSSESGTNQTLTLKGDKNAADSGTDVIVETSVDRTAGSLFRVNDNGTERFRIGFDGEIYKNGSVLSFTETWTSSFMTADNTTTTTLEDLAGLSFAYTAGTYVIRACILTDSGDGASYRADCQVKASGAGTVGYGLTCRYGPDGGALQDLMVSATGTDFPGASINAGGTVNAYFLDGILDVSTSGTFQLQGHRAGGTADPTFMAGSWIEYRKVN